MTRDVQHVPSVGVII